MSQRRLMAFRTTRSIFCILRGNSFIWHNLRGLLSLHDPIPDLDGVSQELDWAFVGNRRLSMISTNDAYKVD